MDKFDTMSRKELLELVKVVSVSGWYTQLLQRKDAIHRIDVQNLALQSAPLLP